MRRAIWLWLLIATVSAAFAQAPRPPVDRLSKLIDVQITSPTTGQALIYDASVSKWKNGAGGGGGPVVGAVGFSTDGAGSSISTGIKGYITVDYTGTTGTINGWSITADGTSPTATIDVWAIAYNPVTPVLPTVTNTIFGTKPALSNGNAKAGTCPADCSGWTTTFTGPVTFGFKIDAVTIATKLTFTLQITR